MYSQKIYIAGLKSCFHFVDYFCNQYHNHVLWIFHLVYASEGQRFSIQINTRCLPSFWHRKSEYCVMHVFMCTYLYFCFHILPLSFHLVSVPTYICVAVITKEYILGNHIIVNGSFSKRYTSCWWIRWINSVWLKLLDKNRIGHYLKHTALLYLSYRLWLKWSKLV